MSEIAILAPIDEIMDVAKKACIKIGKEIPIIKKVTLEDAISVSKELETNGTEVIISRGTIGMKISQSDIKIPVVQIPITGYDLLRSITEARKLGGRIGIADVPDVLQGIEVIESSLGITIEKIPVHSIDEVALSVESLLKKKIDVLIGKSVYVDNCKTDAVKTVVLSSGIESIIQAINEAETLIEVRRAELKRTKQLQTILDVIGEGVIAVDENGFITAFNPSALKILKIQSKEIIGMHIEDILSDSHISKVISTGNEELNKILEINGVQIITSHVPIRHEENIFGAVCTFQELTKLQQQEQEIRKKLLHRGHITKYHLNNIVGKSKSYQAVIEKAKKYSQVDSTVLLTGETGVGKEVFSQLIHSLSNRSDGPFVAVNCAAIPKNLIESELFGYVEGAFTGARKGGKAGLFELAHQGTIFLDEIGELEESVQAQLLRVLQEGEVMRIGDERVIPINIRVIAASNRNFEKMVKNGEFREDLYYRLNILDIMIPPLRERVEDIPLLCKSFISELKQKINPEIIGFTSKAMELLQKYQWPGNIRQLRNIVERCMILSPHQMIQVETVLDAGGKDFENIIIKKTNQQLEDHQGKDKLVEYQRDYVLDVLKQVNGNKTEAAKILGIGRTTLWRMLNNQKRR
ncbi:sigma 54-interacting transcriptional regulator [Bacillus nitroreducens]